MTFIYPAVFSPKKDGKGYHVEFPDLACCEADGPDLEEEEEDCEIPAASPMDELEQKLKEGEFIRNIMVRIKLLPDND